MKHTEPIMKGNKAEGLGSAVEQARIAVSNKQTEVQQAEHDAEELARELMEIQLAQSEKENAEREGKEKERQIEAVSER